MGLISKIAGAGINAIGQGMAASAMNKGYNQYIQTFEDRMQQVKDHRDNMYYQDPTQTAENQAAVTNAQKVLDKATETAKNTNIVSGGSDEAVALSKQAAQEQVGKIMQDAAVQGAQQKENVWNGADSQINQMTSYIASAKRDKALGKAQAISQAASGLGQAAGELPI